MASEKITAIIESVKGLTVCEPWLMQWGMKEAAGSVSRQ